MNLFYQPLIPQGIFYLDPDESRHCIKVLRRSQGDVIRITDGAGSFYNAVITRSDPQQCWFDIRQQIKEPEKNFSIHIAISPTKNADRIEWFTEKAVEFGIDHITLLECKNTERVYLKTERLQKMAISAMKQSLKARLPKITGPMPFREVVQKKAGAEGFIAFVDHTNPDHLKDLAKKDQHYIVLIGPEGDFSDDELHMAIDGGFTKVSLGNSRLRTETAGLAACHILNLVNS